MTKAFTFLCDKVNLSLFNDTLTVYPKPKMELPPVRDEFSLLMFVLFSRMDCVSAKVSDFFEMRKSELGIYRFVHRDDSDHHLYHQDNFSVDASHYHAQFEKVIDESKLKEILDVLESYALITSAEHANFINAYRQANTLPEVSISKKSVIAEEKKVETEKVVEKTKEKETFGGFKRGFFLNPSSTKTPTVQKKDDHTSEINFRSC